MVQCPQGIEPWSYWKTVCDSTMILSQQVKKRGGHLFHYNNEETSGGWKTDFPELRTILDKGLRLEAMDLKFYLMYRNFPSRTKKGCFMQLRQLTLRG